MSRDIRILIALTVLAGMASQVRADDWPMFGGTPQRNMVNLVEKNIPAKWAYEKNIKWVADLGSRAFGDAVVAQSMTATERRLYAIESAEAQE